MEAHFISIEQAAEALGIGRSLAYQLIRRAALPSVTIGRRRLVPVKALERWVEEQAEQVAPRKLI